MDKYGIERAMIGVATSEESPRVEDSQRAVPRTPIGSSAAWTDPNRGMEAVRTSKASRSCRREGRERVPVRPQSPGADQRQEVLPDLRKCVELDIPINVCAGVPGPRVPFAQYVGLIDEVCWFFPELKFVTRHGCEPWADLAVKLLLKWPNLYYSTSAFAPKYYPKDVVDFANTRGADKVMYAGYFPMGLSLERIFGEMPDVPFRDHVWPKFLRENAIRVFKLDS